MNYKKVVFVDRAFVFLLSAILAAVFLLPVYSWGKEKKNIVRVGWYDSSFNMKDDYGHRSGYAYEYQLKLSAFTGWDYEYINGSWPELLAMLEKGEIDMLSDVSFTEERTDKMLFTSLPMGTEEYYLFVSPGNRDILPTDPSTLNGKRIGVNKGSFQADLYRQWAKEHNIQAELVELTSTEDESLAMLETGTLDAYVTVDAFKTPTQVFPVQKIGSSDFFFAVSKTRPDLLDELNNAMNRIQDENRFYNQEMFSKYFINAGANAVLTPDETDWLKKHGPIRVGYLDNHLALCDEDNKTGELTGVLKDYLTYASDCLANVHIDFEKKAYTTAEAAFEGLKKNEIDCVFPVNLSGYEGESMGFIITSPLIETEIYAITRAANQRVISDKKNVIVAVNEGNLNYEAFLRENYPDWKKIYFPTTEDCLKAVSDQVADCVLISNYRYNNLERLCDDYNLTPLTTGIGLDYCFAINKGNTGLYPVLAKVISHVPRSNVYASLSFYITEDARLSFLDFLTDHLTVVMGVTGLILMIIIALLIGSISSARKARELIQATEIDKLTGLYNRDFFLEYAAAMSKEHPEVSMDAIVLNIEQFHSINAINGRIFGNRVLRTLGEELHDIAMEYDGIAGRFEADRFDLYCRHLDNHQALFDRLQSKLDTLAPRINIRLRMGVMPWQPDLDLIHQFDMARTACNMARGSYKEHLIVFNEMVHRQEIYEQRLVNDLRRALDSFEFEIYYQPKFDISGEKPKLVSAEALVRWRHPELGMILPGDFIPLFERNGQIGLIDRYVWEEAARQIVGWYEQYGFTLPVSVNVSRVDLFDPDLEKTLDLILRYYNLDPADFRLEITETAYTENADQVIRVVESLRKKGCKIEMDDFGTGYSSLNMLSTMPVDALKMDRLFISNIDHEEKNLQMASLILGIAKTLKIPVIAEGVETEEQLNLLKSLGCTVVQGFYFSRPLHASDFEAKYLQETDSDN